MQKPSISPDTLIALTQHFGKPLFVYDADVIDRQIDILKTSFHVDALDIRYACKSLSTIGILKHIHNQGCGVDTVSPGEILMALRAGIPPEQISFTPSGVLLEEYEFAIQHRVHIHVDQMHVLEWLEANHPGVAITMRFNPGIQAGGHSKLQVGMKGSKFGFLLSQLDDLLHFLSASSLKVSGVHMHLGSDISDADSFARAYANLLTLATLWSNTITHVNVGGGFKVPYHPDDDAIDMQSFGRNVSETFNDYSKSIDRQLSLVIEPGKFIVSEAGTLLMEVTSLRAGPDRPLVYVQSGFNHFVRPMNYDAYHHIINLSNPDGKISAYDIVGNLCETDTFGTDRNLHEVRRGDILCLLNAGAYGYTMASNYNGRLRPAEVLVKEGIPALIRREETFDDLLRTDLNA